MPISFPPLMLQLITIFFTHPAPFPSYITSLGIKRNQRLAHHQIRENLALVTVSEVLRDLGMVYPDVCTLSCIHLVKCANKTCSLYMLKRSW